MEAVYLKGKTIESAFLMLKENRALFVHHIPGYISKIDFLDSPTYFGEEHESKEMIPCTKDEYMEAFNEALKVINSKL